KGREARDQILAPLPGRLVAISWYGSPRYCLTNYKVSFRRVVPRNYDPKGERFLIASRFSTPPLACAFFSPGATVTALYTGNFCCSKGSVEDKILVPKPRKNCARCAKCGHPNTSESSDDSTNVVNAPREPFVVKQDHGVKSSQNPPPIDECCCECTNALDGIFCQQCICKSCGKGAHIGYNCPPKVPIISNPEPCNQTINNEPPQTLPSFNPPCYSEKEKSVPCVSKPHFVDGPSNIFNPPPQPPIYSCKFCGSDAQYGHYCIPQAQCNNPEPGSDDGVTTSLQLRRNSRPPMLDHQDKYMMKAQVYVSKSFAISDIQALPRRKYFLLSSGKASVEGEIVSKLSRSRA
nr:hypothetical protein [Tanacetum cinerariifolium]